MHVNGRCVRCRIIPPATQTTVPAPLSYPLLLLHGLGCSADIWNRALRHLACCSLTQGVIAPDLPGYGHSAGPKEVLGIDALADWMVDLLDALQLNRVHVAGNSMGCQVALALARRHPARVGGLVLVGPTLGGGLVPGWRYALGLLADGLREPVFYNGKALLMYLQMGIPRFAATVVKMLSDNTLGHAVAVHAPCLIMRGGGDWIVPDASARRLASTLSQGTFTKITGAGHAVEYNCPETFAQIAMAFLAGAEVRRGEESERLEFVGN